MSLHRASFSLSGIDAFATEFIKNLRWGDTICLIGELGFGKTTFVGALLRGLGSSEAVTSPTYVLQHIYTLPDNKTVEHWDLYRLAALPEELILEASLNSIRLIEWGDKFSELIREADVTIRFSMSDNEEANIRIIDWDRAAELA